MSENRFDLTKGIKYRKGINKKTLERCHIKISCNRTDDCSFMIKEKGIYDFNLKCPTCGNQIGINKVLYTEMMSFDVEDG